MSLRLRLGKGYAFERRRPGRWRRGRGGYPGNADGGLILPDTADVQLAALIADDMHHGLLERHLFDLDTTAQQGHQRDLGVNVGGPHEWRLGEIRIVGNRDTAEIGYNTPSQTRVDILDVDLAPERVARLGQDEAALLLDDPVEVEHGVNHHRGHHRNDDADHDYGRSDKLAHHDTPSRSDEISFSAEAGGYDNAAAPS